MLIAFLIGAIDSLVVWAIAGLFDVTILIPESLGSETLTELTLLATLVVVAIASILAGVLLWPLLRFAHDRALLIFQIVAVIVMAASLLSPLSLDQPIEGKLALIAIHLLVGSAIIAVFTWVGSKPRRRSPVEQPVQE